MEGHETGNWELLKKELIRKWGRATPLRRYKEDSIPRLIRKAQENGGINTRLEYKKFISEFEEIMDYFTRMEYQNLNPDSGNPLWKALSTEFKKEVTKELAHAKQLQTTKDGRNIVPDLEKLKKYVEIALIIVDFDGDDEEYKPKEQVKKTVKIQEPATKEYLEENLTKLTSALEYQNCQAPPHVSRPSSTSAVAEIEEWGSWVPPQVNMEEGDLQNNLGFGLRKSQRLQEKNAPSGSQPAPSNPIGTEGQSSNIQDKAPKTATRRKVFRDRGLKTTTTRKKNGSLYLLRLRPDQFCRQKKSRLGRRQQINKRR
ncbi:hypothetical protein PGTUg99_000994 [Puccinia graminis f. sp. tritici]|uniref:Uncharacterized protein n=1 Tax=Puccinia graminis f. sp. tritici TaxID=56615 RepID=A0A5B0N6M2_PUCGR|nr:hypothetical protein PGTUg99_000994 [Puccinia graminis f. sp. tritici]